MRPYRRELQSLIINRKRIKVCSYPSFPLCKARLQDWEHCYIFPTQFRLSGNKNCETKLKICIINVNAIQKTPEEEDIERSPIKNLFLTFRSLKSRKYIKQLFLNLLFGLQHVQLFLNLLFGLQHAQFLITSYGYKSNNSTIVYYLLFGNLPPSYSPINNAQW